MLKDFIIRVVKVQKKDAKTGRTFYTYFGRYGEKKDDIGSISVRFSNKAKIVFDTMLDKLGSKAVDLKLDLKLPEDGKRDGGYDAFLTCVSKKGEDGKYHEVYDKQGLVIPEIVIVSVSDSRIAPHQDQLDKDYNDHGFSSISAKLTHGIKDPDEGLPF